MRTHFARLASLLVIVALGAIGCPSGSDSAPGESPPPVVNTDWNQGMTLEELREIAEALGVDLVEEGESSIVSKDDVVKALEDATGCGCFGAVCGVGSCGHECGSCTGDDTCFSGTCESTTSCHLRSLTAETQEALLRDDTESLKFRFDATMPPGSGLDRVRIYYNSTVDDPLGPGTYDLRHHTMSDCKPCVAAYTNCLPDGTCAQPFMAQAGIVTIDEITPGGQFSGSLSNVKFDYSYEDPKTGLFTVIPSFNEQFGAECVEDFSFDVHLESIVVEPQDCDPEGNGTGINNKLRDFTLKNCNGEDVNLHSACGKKALWIIAAAGW